MAAKPTPLTFTLSDPEPAAAPPPPAAPPPEGALDLTDPLLGDDLGPPPSPPAQTASAMTQASLAPALEPGVVLTRLELVLVLDVVNWVRSLWTLL